MDDLIRKQDAIDAVLKLQRELQMMDSDNGKVISGVQYSIKRIESIQPAQQWNPCSEGLPKKEEDYLLFGKVADDDEEEYQFIGNYDIGCEKFGIWQEQFDRSTLGCLGSEFFEYASVIAWMPLPKPWKGSDEKK